MTLAAVTLVVVAGAWALRREPAGTAPPPAAASGRPPASAVVSGAATVTQAVQPAASGQSAHAGVRYTFDGGVTGPVLDGAGRLPLRIRSAGGELSAVPHAGGLAVRFPPRCEHYGAQSCARAILQSGPAEFLNPGQGAFTYGASVLVGPDETSKGANVLQKGFSVGDSQFKLQVDGAAGHPSCVIVGTGGPTIYVALASLTVADGRWHRVECSRRDALLTVAVDGQLKGRSAIPSSLSIVNADPLCIGGKGTSANNDQFTGAIDDVYVTKAA
ncbi:LamG domain-containing protein [Dactylosporangium aurantiacum]|uniref:LamG domain-containing protein n=1 Tax=Dactylosporangium aurantiacum TaxID=35754 RepID=A0A9Q9MMJ1_9ACTN|nr:LamG-like jellyroll fold domain-containing protein [Dactylosporangium aurantiacum]MDG6101181.1 LamG domain-containing protein [Dactylosporangium aurantiacum]UWZ54792.1 LamG domain-containing protein [Dactylosporangium aurantiacum]